MSQILCYTFQASPWTSTKHRHAQVTLTIVPRIPNPCCLLRLCVQHLGAGTWGWSAGQEAMTWLPQWPGGGQHSFHRHFSTAPDSSVPKLALAISNFDISSGNHVTGTSVFKIRVALTFLSPRLCGQAGEVWKAPSGSAVLVVRALEEGPHGAGVLPPQALGLKDPVPPGAGGGLEMAPQGWPGDEMWEDMGGAGINPPWSLACSAFQLPSEGQHSLV